MAIPIVGVKVGHPSFLATMTVKTGTLSLANLLDRRVAPAARCAAASIYLVILLEIAGLSCAIDEVAQAASTKVDGCGQGGADFFDQTFTARQAQLSGGKLRFDAGMKQGFIRVDISYPNHDVIVHDALLDSDATSTRCLIKIVRIEAMLKRFRAKFDEQRVRVYITRVPQYCAEAARIT